MINKIDDFVFNELTQSELEKYKKVIDERLDYVKNNPIIPKEKYWLHVDFYYGDGDRTVDYVQEINYKTYQALEQCDKTKEYEFYNEFLGCPEGTINDFCKWFKTTGSKDYSRNLEDGDWNMDNVLEELVRDFDLKQANESFKKESEQDLLNKVNIYKELLDLDELLDSGITLNKLTDYITRFETGSFKQLLKLLVLNRISCDFALVNIFEAIDNENFDLQDFYWDCVEIEVRDENHELQDFCIMQDDFKMIEELYDDYLISKKVISAPNSECEWDDNTYEIYYRLIDIENIREFIILVKSYYI